MTVAFQVPPDLINLEYQEIAQLGPAKTLVLEKLYKKDIEDKAPIGQISGLPGKTANVLSNLALKGYAQGFQAAGPDVWNEAKQFLNFTKAEQIDVMNKLIELTQQALQLEPPASEIDEFDLPQLPPLESLEASPDASLILPPPPSASLEQIYTNP